MTFDISRERDPINTAQTCHVRKAALAVKIA
jgi:hypothetical protein